MNRLHRLIGDATVETVETIGARPTGFFGYVAQTLP